MWDQLLKPGLTGAPQVIEWSAIGLGLFLATFIGRLNILRGRQSPPASGPVGQIAGAIISDVKAEVIVAAIDKQTAETTKMVAALRATIRALDMTSNSLQANTDTAKDVGAAIDEARTDIRRLTDEMMRGR